MAKKRAARQSNRIPVSGARSKMNIPEHLKEPGFQYRWVNDEGGKIQTFLQAGYEFVEEPDMEVGDSHVDKGRPTEATVSTHVGQTRYSNNGTAYLMRIPNEYYEEDQNAKQEELDHLEEGMFKPNKADAQYVSEYKQTRSLS